MGLPEVTTLPATDITSTNFTPNGNITDAGGSAITRRGFYYIKGSNRNPVFEGSHQLGYEDGQDFGTGEYNLQLFDSPLLPIPATTYSVRSFAVNSSGTGYGNIINVTTASDVPTILTSSITSRTDVSFLGNGNITNLSGRPVTKRGFCYIPLVSNNFVDNCDNLDNWNDENPDVRPIILDDPSGQFKFYYNGDGQFPNGASISLKGEFIPKGFTDNLTFIVRTKFDTGLEAFNIGNETTFILSVSSDPNWFLYVLFHSNGLYIEYDDWNGYYINIGPTSVKSGLGAIFQNWKFILNFNDGTVEVFLMNDGDFVYSSLGVVPFSFSSIGNPTWVNLSSFSSDAHPETTQVAHVDLIEFDGCYNIPTISDSTSSESSTGFSLGTYSLSIPGLTPSTFYAVRAYATNSMGTGYGYTLASETAASGELPGDISVQTDPATSITKTSFTGNGEIINTAGYDATNVGIVYLIHEGVPTVPTLFFYPCTNLSGWTINAPTTGTVIVDGYDGFKFDSGSSTGSDIEIYRTDVGWGANRILVVRVKTYFNSDSGSSELYINFDNTSYGSIQIIFNISDNLISVGSNIIPGTGVLKSGVSAADQTWEFRIDATNDMAVICEVYLDNASLSRFTSGVEDRILSNQNRISWTHHGLTDINVFLHLKEISAQLGTSMSSISHYNVDLGVAPFSFPITNLTPNTDYIVRAYGINQEATAYGNSITVPTLPESENRYWIAHIESDFENTDNWSETLGGPGGASVPTTGQTAYFPNSISTLIRINSAVLCDISTSLGCSFTFSIRNGGILTLQETLYAHGVEVYSGGTFTTNNNTVNLIFSLWSEAGATLNLGTSIFNIGGSGANLVLAGTVGSTAASFILIVGSSNSINGGGNTIKSLDISNNGTLYSSSSIVIGDASGLVLNGDTEGGLVLHSFVVSMASGTVNATKSTLINSVASGGATFNSYISNGCVDGGGNTGWNFGIGLPTVDTTGVTDITVTSFIAHGAIIDSSGSDSTTVGFCYIVGTVGTPTIDDSIVYEDGNYGVGSFSLPVTGLSIFTNYRVRAYAINSEGVGYGTTISTRTLSEIPTLITNDVSSITSDSFFANGDITDTGGEECSRRGFCYKVGMSGDPTTSDSTIYSNGSFETGAYDEFINLLLPDTYYRVRSYAINSAGTGYGNTVAAQTSFVSPTVVTDDATSIDSYSFTANGEITNTGGVNATTVGFCYIVGTVGTPTIGDSIVYEDGDFGAESYSLPITGLKRFTSYRVRSYAINPLGIGYGNTITVMTLRDNAEEGIYLSFNGRNRFSNLGGNLKKYKYNKGVIQPGFFIKNYLPFRVRTRFNNNLAGEFDKIQIPIPIPIVEISANPEILTLYGDPTTLRWSSSGVTSCSIDQGIGSVALSGSLVVYPTEDTIYTIIGVGYSTDSTASVEVYAVPTVNMSASPSTVISYGDPSTLTWTSTNTISCSIDQGIGSVALSGSMSVTPLSRTIYTITATGDTGIVTSAAKVIEVLKEYHSYVTTLEPIIDSGTYHIPPPADPTFSTLPDFVDVDNMPISLTISDITSGSSIYYTINGNNPDNTSTLYTTPIPLTSDEFTDSTSWPEINVKAIAQKTGVYSSVVQTTTYKLQSGIFTINPPMAIAIENKPAMFIDEPGIDSGNYYAVVVTTIDYSDYMDSTNTYSIEIGEPVIDSGNYYDAIVPTVDYSDYMDSTNTYSIEILDPVIDSGNYWKAIVEG